MIKGKVTRPAYGSGDGVLTLTATVTKGLATKTKIYSSSVKEAGMTDTQRVAADKNWLDIVGKDTIKTNLSLPSVGPNGTAITWATSAAATITTGGAVTRPVNGQPITPVTLTATVSLNAITETKIFECKVLPWTNQEEVDLDLESITWDSIRGQNISKSEIAYDLALATLGAHGSTIAWSSTNTAVCSNVGQVVRPSFTQGDVSFSLTYTVTKGDVTKTAYLLALKVVKLPITNNESVTRALSLIDASTIKGTNTDLNNVISNLTLPKSVAAPECSTVSFSWDVVDGTGTVVTTNPNVKIVDSGTSYIAQVTQPGSASSNAAVILRVTATSQVAAGDLYSGYKSMNITVLKAV